NSVTKTYDGKSYTSFTRSISGFINSDSENVVTGMTTYSGTGITATQAGSYTITPVISGLSSPNYIFTAVGGTLTISKATLTVTATDKSATYTGAAYTGSNTSAITGFVNNETSAVVSGVVTFTGNAANATNAGNYSITPVVSALTATNYNFAAKDGKLTINKATITVAAEAKEKIRDGKAFTAFTSTMQGFLNNDTDAVVSGSIAYVGSAKTATRTGIYTITPDVTGLLATNYSFAKANSSLTIRKSTSVVSGPNANWELENGAILKGDGKTNQTVLTYIATYSSPLTKAPVAAGYNVTNGKVTKVEAVGTDKKTYRVTITASASTLAPITVTSSIKSGWNGTGPASDTDSVEVFNKTTQTPRGKYGAIGTGYINASVTEIKDLVFSLPAEVDPDTVGPEDFTVNGATIANLSVAPDGKSITLDLARTISNTNSGDISVTLKANTIEDLYGNFFMQSDTLKWVYDDMPPTVALALVSGTGKLKENITVSISTSEMITNFLPTMIYATINGVEVAATTTGSRTGWNFVIRPDQVGTLVISMKTGNLGLVDRAGNAIVAAPIVVTLNTYVST
ncbi:MAG: hypothetical protein EBS30_15070, partial [Planctomycetes bacterium]|nr:hypothetical protein [Planctomycetota bacterium]